MTDSPTPPGRPGQAIFTIEGRAAPGLFVVGWLATILGLGVGLVGFLAGSNLAGSVMFVVGALLLSIGLIAGAGSQAIERQARDAPWGGPSPWLLFAVTLPVTYLATVVVGGPLAVANVRLDRPLVELLLVILQGAIFVGLVRFLVVGTGALSWTGMGIGWRAGRSLDDLGWGALIAGPVILLTIVLANVLVALTHVAPDSPLPPTGTATGLALHLVAGAMVAPVAEEILFRGVATTAWVRSLGARAGIVRGAVLFAFAHIVSILLGGSDAGQTLTLAFVAFVGRLPIALALGWVYVRRGSLWSSIGLHAVFNGVLIVLAEVATRG